MILLNRAVKPKYSGNFAGGGGSPPAWLAGAALLSWTQIVGSAMANLTVSVNPGGKPVGSIINDWSGYAFDQVNNIGWAIGTGGHDDYWGNQVLNFLLNVATPGWAEVLASTSGFTTPSDTVRYSDGSVPSAHTYFCSHYIHALARALRFPGGSYATVGNPKATTEGFDPATGQWEAALTYPTLSVVTMPPAPATWKHTTSEDVYVAQANNNLQRWNRALNTYTALNPVMPVSLSESSSAHDSLRDKTFHLGGSEGTVRHLYDVAGNSFSTLSIAGDLATAIAASAYNDRGYGLGYDPHLDKFLARLGDAGGDVYSVSPTGGGSVALSTTGGGSIPGTFVLSGSPPSQNVYTKWQYVSDLGGYSGWLYTPSHTSDSWFLRTN